MWTPEQKRDLCRDGPQRGHPCTTPYDPLSVDWPHPRDPFRTGTFRGGCLYEGSRVLIFPFYVVVPGKDPIHDEK